MATDLKSPERLLEALEALAPPTAASAFVLLWTWFREVGLGSVENSLRRRGEHPFRLEPYPPRIGGRRAVPADAVRRLGELRARKEDFDVLALRWLKGLDLYLKDQSSARWDGEFRGLDGDRYRLRRWNNLIADHYRTRRRGVRWARHESAAIGLYARHQVAVPVRPIEGLELEIRSEDRWGTPALHGRLRQGRRGLRIMSWPLRTEIDYPDVPRTAGSRAGKGGPADPEFVRLSRVGNQGELLDELREAVAAARREKVTILILPELAIPGALEEELGRILAGNGDRGYPILTLFGCCHRRNDAGDDVNEAALLGPDGRELHRHRKVSAFTHVAGFAEPNRVGDRVAVLETCLGNLVPLICLDFFHHRVGPRVEASHGNLFLVPSLSDKTTAHVDAAKKFQVTRLASSFVCNRRFDRQPSPAEPEGTSFYRVPRRSKPLVAHFAPDARKVEPYLVFAL